MTDNYLRLEAVWFRYGGVAASPDDVLKNVSLELGARECTAVVGAGGSGKTTLIQHFTGLLRPTRGRVTFHGRDIWARGFSQSDLRRRIGLVFQFPEMQLFEETVEKDVAFGPRNFGLAEEEIHRRVEQALKDVNLDPQRFRQRSPFRLSEGEKRRAAIAGVLAMEPEMLVFDEPTAGLDPDGVRGFIALVQRLLQKGKAVVVVTHHMDFVAEAAQRVIALCAGEVIFDGAPEKLFADHRLLDRAGLEPPSLVHTLNRLPSLPEDVRSALTMKQLRERLERIYGKRA